MAEENHHLHLSLTSQAKDWLSAQGFDPIFGARPLKRVMQREITNRLAQEILGGWVNDGDEIAIDLAPSGKGLSFGTIEDAVVVDEFPHAPVAEA